MAEQDRDLKKDVEFIAKLVSKPNTNRQCFTFKVDEEITKIIDAQPELIRDHVRSMFQQAIGRAREEGVLAGLRYASGEKEVQIGDSQTTVAFLIACGETEVNFEQFMGERDSKQSAKANIMTGNIDEFARQERE